MTSIYELSLLVLKLYDFSSSGVGALSLANAAGGGGERAEGCKETYSDRCNPPALMDALKHGNPFLWIRMSILSWLPKICEPCCATFGIGNIFRPAAPFPRNHSKSR